ncbi:actin-like ATPase domain-containing protein [Metschnikowia bicuspidata var. bicuspidata NRRL YB-4993]|uniref:Actin-like ATPase domain-containing protein n=1 Tax=Metschnikowia bicuspidata var. bicuspidata NRRL YB-4993 TaxID=869754 RepID=A0A1A0HHX3_9ASCO|nr:actin-like ATPase domain-containing protein [Metschnikowia bicuspidata var. bicuspidata NRRL YB-4993]OBA23443.1 actin-like ATPase domain-containing protein [Metschnikowia bicuspidata var. bicuspidata NRRL YB-4993]
MKFLSICYAWSAVSAAIVGIDFGHKYTKAMMVAPGIRFEIIPTDGGNRKDLSAIYVEPKVSKGELEDVERAYGSQIGSLCSRSPESCAANLKSLLGKTTNDSWVEAYLEQNPHFNIVPNNERQDAIAFELGRSGESFTFSAEELAAMSLADLKERVIKALTQHPQARAIAEDVAMSIPPFSNQISRLAFRDALHLANFSSVLGLVDEGCAAALAYVSDKKLAPEEYDNNTVHQIIYDIGAGSATATLFSFTPFENRTILLDVQSVGFDDSLGGDLLTQHVYEILSKKFREKFKLDEAFEMPFRLAARLIESAEKAKTVLSANADSMVSLESFYNDEDFKAMILRKEFEDATSKLIDRVNKPILDALRNSPSGPKTISDIESVILNGGATRTPFIQKQLVNLLGEGKISKVLNADEACAYGTTIRAYQLKMITGSGTDVILKDRILNDFEISINGSDEKQLVFPKGSSAGNTSLVNLGQITGDTILLGLHENGQLYGSYNVSRIASRASDMTCFAEDINLYAQFVIGEDKIFTLDNLYLNCKVTKKAESEEVVIDEKNSTKLNSTYKRPTKSTANVLVPAISFTSLRPYTVSEKKAFLSKLNHLKELEKEKLIFKHAKNLLESACYNLQFYIEDHYEMFAQNLGEAELEQIQSNAGDMLEWVEYESDSATVEEVEEKMRNVKASRKYLEDTMRMLDADLSLSAMRDLLDEGNQLSLTVQDTLLEFGSQAQQMREKYEADGFEFDIENEKIMKKIHGIKLSDQLELEKHFLEFKKALKELTQMTSVSQSKYEKLEPRTKFETSELVHMLMIEMIKDGELLKKQHEQRLTYLLNRLEKLKERKKQKELKAKLKEEKEKEKAANVDEEVVEEVENAYNNTEYGFPELNNQTIDSESSNVENENAEADHDDAKNQERTDEHDEL